MCFVLSCYGTARQPSAFSPTVPLHPATASQTLQEVCVSSGRRGLLLVSTRAGRGRLCAEQHRCHSRILQEVRPGMQHGQDNGKSSSGKWKPQPRGSRAMRWPLGFHCSNLTRAVGKGAGRLLCSSHRLSGSFLILSTVCCLGGHCTGTKVPETAGIGDPGSAAQLLQLQHT